MTVGESGLQRFRCAPDRLHSFLRRTPLIGGPELFASGKHGAKLWRYVLNQVGRNSNDAQAA
jgi:hypothetical protein